MASKKLGCPLSSIFHQWGSAQDQRQNKTVDIESKSHLSPSSLSYRILLQTTYSLKTRSSAAEPVENPHLYKRAGLATPAERAIRDIRGASETAWLLHLVELAAQQGQKTKDLDGANNSTADPTSIIFLATKPGSEDCSLLQELPQDVRSKVRVLDIGSRDPFGWEEKENDAGDGTSTGFTLVNNLRQLYRRLQGEFDRTTGNSGTRVILIWQSLTPLIVLHGFKKVLRLLCALPTCLQIWPVNSQSLTPEQNAQLEDASNAILYLHSGEMNIIRQGIRERGNVLRQKLPFRLEAIVSDRHTQNRFRIVKEAEVEEIVNNGDDDDNRSVKSARNSDKEGYRSNAIAEDKSRMVESSSVDSRSRGAQFRIEESDGGRKEGTGGNLSSENGLTTPHRPRIYLQDDDPEFDDFDEEDPDDDLDI